MGCAAAAATAALAEPDMTAVLEIDGEVIRTINPTPADGNPLRELISGWHFRNPDTRDLQADDFENPAMVYVEHGLELWETPMGTSNQSCADCHGEPESFRGLRAGMPKWSEAAGKPMTLEQWINWSLVEHAGAEPWKWESQEMLGMTALIALQSRGMPVDVETDGPMAEWWKRGEEMYYTRTGQLDFSCANCHEENNGRMLRADHLSQGHSNGFPLYRLKWQSLGTIHRRLEGCITDTRAETYPRGSDELVALELYVAWRGEGLAVEAPAVRN
jgi:sulfur-oxidizing protein SoxA